MGFVVVALLSNVSKSGHVLIVEGLDGPGTQTAVDLLLRGDMLRPVLTQATRPDGTLGSFEVLLAATSLDTRATDAHIIAERYYPYQDSDRSLCSGGKLAGPRVLCGT